MVPTTQICSVAGAKLNLALHVRQRRDDGYHEIDSVFVHTMAGDRLWAEPAESLSLVVTGPFAAALGSTEDNLVLRAARAVAEWAMTLSRAGVCDSVDLVTGARQSEAGAIAPSPHRGARLTLEKNLPIASGVGGGSADAAAAIMLLVDLWDLPDDHAALVALASPLGADVAPCLQPWPKHVVGRGEDYVAIADPAYRGRPVLLLNPRVPLATGPVFAGWDGIDRGAIADVSFTAVCARGRNDLTLAAAALVPAIGLVLAALDRTGAAMARMSGSGATCFALYDTDLARDVASAAIASAHPGWWRLATRLH